MAGSQHKLGALSCLPRLEEDLLVSVEEWWDREARGCPVNATTTTTTIATRATTTRRTRTLAKLRTSK